MEDKGGLRFLLGVFITISVAAWLLVGIFGQGLSEFFNGTPHYIAEAAYQEVWDLRGCYLDQEENSCPDHYITRTDKATDNLTTFWCIDVYYQGYERYHLTSVVVRENHQDGQVDAIDMSEYGSYPCLE